MGVECLKDFFENSELWLFVDYFHLQETILAAGKTKFPIVTFFEVCK